MPRIPIRASSWSATDSSSPPARKTVAATTASLRAITTASLREPAREGTQQPELVGGCRTRQALRAAGRHLAAIGAALLWVRRDAPSRGLVAVAEVQEAVAGDHLLVLETPRKAQPPHRLAGMGTDTDSFTCRREVSVRS